MRERGRARDRGRETTTRGPALGPGGGGRGGRDLSQPGATDGDVEVWSERRNIVILLS